VRPRRVEAMGFSGVGVLGVALLVGNGKAPIIIRCFFVFRLFWQLDFSPLVCALRIGWHVKTLFQVRKVKSNVFD
jgi:hypothetical protein